MNLQCPGCSGKGWILATSQEQTDNVRTLITLHDCELCHGDGRVEESELGDVA